MRGKNRTNPGEELSKQGLREVQTEVMTAGAGATASLRGHVGGGWSSTVGHSDVVRGRC